MPIRRTAASAVAAEVEVAAAAAVVAGTVAGHLQTTVVLAAQSHW